MGKGTTVAAGLILVAAGAAGAQQLAVSGRASDIAQERRALEQAKAQAAQARRLSEAMERRASRTAAEADRLNAQAAALAARIQQSEADLRAGEARVAIVGRLVAAQADRLAERQEPVVRLTAALQSVARRPPVLALLQPGSVADAVHVRAVLQQVLPVIRARTAQLRAELDRARMLQAMAVQANRALARNRTTLASQRAGLEKLEAQKRVAARGLASSAGLEAERATAMGERARDIGDLMTELEAAGATRERLVALPGPLLRPGTPGAGPAPQADSADARQGTPAYRLPVIGTIVTGMGEVSSAGVRSRGIGIAARSRAQIVAPAPGRVAFAGPYRGYGNIVIVDHGDGWSSLLAGLDRLSTAVGQTVTQGSPLGIAPAARNPVITVELRRQGRPVDIAAMIAAAP